MKAKDLVSWASHHSLTRSTPNHSVSVLLESNGPDKESETHFSQLRPAKYNCKHGN